DEWQRRLEDLSRTLSETEREEQAIIEAREACTRHMADAEQALAVRREEKAALNCQLHEAEQQRSQAQEQLQQVEAESQRWEVLAYRREVELDHLLSSLSREYGISYEWAKTHYSVPDDPAVAEKEVARLKNELERLGEVNLGAMDEYERLAQRHQFLSDQQADLLAAKATLQAAIQELDEKIAVRFQTAFDAIRAHFQELF